MQEERDGKLAELDGKLAAHKQLSTSYRREGDKNIYKIITFPNELVLLFLTLEHPLIQAWLQPTELAFEFCHSKNIQLTVQEGFYNLYLMFTFMNLKDRVQSFEDHKQIRSNMGGEISIPWQTTRNRLSIF